MRDQRPHVVIVGRPGSGKSAIGAELARATQEPFLDVGAAAEMPRPWEESTHQPSTDELDEAQIDWLNAILAGVGPYVIAAPWCALGQLAANGGDAVIVLLHASDDELRQRLVEDGVDEDQAAAILAAASNDDSDAASRTLIESGAIVVDTSGATVHEAVTMIAGEIARRTTPPGTGSPGPGRPLAGRRH